MPPPPRNRKASSAHKAKPRGKRDGTPEKDEDAASNADSQRKQVIYNEEIAKLEVTDESLAEYVRKMRELEATQLKSPSPESVRVAVRKEIPEDQRPPVLQKIGVLKKAPADAPLKPQELAPGPRFDEAGRLIPHSILGSAEDFYRIALEKGTITADEVPPAMRSARPQESARLTVRRTADFPYPVTDLASEESGALKNWEEKMKERKRQQGYISKLINRPVNELVMNSGELQGRQNLDKHLIDRSIPFYDYGKGYRTGSEFWKQAERIGDEESGIHMTLTQTDKGYGPPVEQIGVPRPIRKEKGTEWLPSPRDGGRYPWKGPFYEQRRLQLNPVIQELCPHEADTRDLMIAGSRTVRSRPTTAVTPSVTQETLPRTPFPSDSPDLEPSSGPSLLFGGQPARWLGDPRAYVDSVAIEARVILETSSGKPTSQYLDIANDGTTVFFYRWKKLPKANPFGLVHESVRRFYFDSSSGVLLPGETLHFPFIFKSDRPGFFTEQWVLETTPVLCGGAALVVTLRGVALQEDTHARKRTELESKLEHAAAERLVRQLVEDLVAGIRERPRPHSPPALTDEQAFKKLNPHLSYSGDIAKRVRALQEQSGSSMSSWNLRELRTQILESDNSQSLSEKLSLAVEKASFKFSVPLVSPGTLKYQLCYRLIMDTMDRVYCDWFSQRSAMGLPEVEMDFPDPTLKKGREKTKSSLKDTGKSTPGKLEMGKSNLSTVSRDRTRSSISKPSADQSDAEQVAQPGDSVREEDYAEELCRAKIASATFNFLSQMVDDLVSVCDSCI